MVIETWYECCHWYMFIQDENNKERSFHRNDKNNGLEQLIHPDLSDLLPFFSLPQLKEYKEGKQLGTIRMQSILTLILVESQILALRTIILQNHKVMHLSPYIGKPSIYLKLGKYTKSYLDSRGKPIENCSFL